jgi:ribosomal protein S16
MLACRKRWDIAMPKISKAPKPTNPDVAKRGSKRRTSAAIDEANERQRRVASAVSRLGTFDQTSPSKKQWAALDLLEREFNWLPQGTAVAVNLQNSQFITGHNHADVIQRFVAAYGSVAQGWMFDVGCPAFVGGLCRT